MNDIEIKQLLELSWRRPLTHSEQMTLQKWWVGHPEQQAAMEMELRLSRRLHQLPNVPVSSNFVSQVWQQVEAAERQDLVHLARRSWRRPWMRWMPRFAVAGGVVAVSFGFWWAHQWVEQRDTATGLVATAGQTLSVDPAMFQEFEVIKALSETSSVVDVELLAALQ